MVRLYTYFIRTIHNPPPHFREYRIGLAPEFIDVLVSTEAYSDLKVSEDHLHDVPLTPSTPPRARPHTYGRPTSKKMRDDNDQ